MVDRLCAAVAMSLGKPLHNWSLHHSSMGVLTQLHSGLHRGQSSGGLLGRVGPRAVAAASAAQGQRGRWAPQRLPLLHFPALGSLWRGAGASPKAAHRELAQAWAKSVAGCFGTRERNSGGLGG